MFNWLRVRKEVHENPSTSVRDTLFGDMPLDAWGADAKQGIWADFANASRCLKSNDRLGAIAALRHVLASPGQESRHYAQAWHFLRQLGETPSHRECKQILGVVVEVPIESGLDMLAAYSDSSARYYNHRGGGIVMDTPPAEIIELISHLIEASIPVVNQIGPWNKERLPPPPARSVRLTFLTPSGIHFGQGPFDQMARDPLACHVIDAAVALMQALVQLTDQQS